MSLSLSIFLIAVLFLATLVCWFLSAGTLGQEMSRTLRLSGVLMSLFLFYAGIAAGWFAIHLARGLR